METGLRYLTLAAAIVGLSMSGKFEFGLAWFFWMILGAAGIIAYGIIWNKKGWDEGYRLGWKEGMRNVRS